MALRERPAQALGAELDEELGRPSKELYAISGLLLIAEFQDWTIDEASDAWTLDAGVQFALHLPRDRQYLSVRTLNNHRRLLREKVEVRGAGQKSDAEPRHKRARMPMASSPAPTGRDIPAQGKRRRSAALGWGEETMER